MVVAVSRPKVFSNCVLRAKIADIDPEIRNLNGDGGKC